MVFSAGSTPAGGTQNTAHTAHEGVTMSDHIQYRLFQPPDEDVEVVPVTYPEYFEYAPQYFVNDVFYDDRVSASRVARILNMLI